MLSGCVTHTLLVNVTTDPDVHYEVDGDSLDVHDGRLRLPDWAPWELVDRTSGMNADSSLSVRLTYRAPLAEPVIHPISSREVEGDIRVEHRSNLLFKVSELTITFPSWEVSDRFGNPEDFVPEEVRQLESVGADTLIAPERQEQLKRLRAVAMQKAAAQRFLKHEQALVESWYQSKGEMVPEEVLSDAMNRFSFVLQAHMLTLSHRDPLDVSLDWYVELRSALVGAASDATGGDLEWFEARMDSIELSYKSWLDLEDDAIQVIAYLPAWRVVTSADTMSGDTLFWELSVDLLSDSTLVLNAVGYTPHLATTLLTLTLLLAVIVLLLLRFSKRRSLPTEKTD